MRAPVSGGPLLPVYCFMAGIAGAGWRDSWRPILRNPRDLEGQRRLELYLRRMPISPIILSLST